MMDVEELREIDGSGKKRPKKSTIGGDETVEDLIAKLEQKGKKVVLQE